MKKHTFELNCLYNDKIRTSFKKPVSELSSLFSAYVPKSKVQEHEFLKLLLETEEQEDNYHAVKFQRTNELGLDESELLEGLRSDNEDARQNEFDSENRLEDDFDDESE